MNHWRSPRIPHRTQPPRQKWEDTRITVDCPLGLELGEGCAKRGRTRSKVGKQRREFRITGWREKRYKSYDVRAGVVTVFFTLEALFTLNCWNRSHRTFSISHTLYSSLWTSSHVYDWYNVISQIIKKFTSDTLWSQLHDISCPTHNRLSEHTHSATGNPHSDPVSWKNEAQTDRRKCQPFRPHVGWRGEEGTWQIQPLALPALPYLPFIYYNMRRITFRTGLPAEAWCRQNKKKRTGNKNTEYQKRRNGRIHERKGSREKRKFTSAKKEVAKAKQENRKAVDHH